MRARMYIEIDTEYGTISRTIGCDLDSEIDDVHKLQYVGSMIYDRLMKDVYKDFKRRAKDGLRRYTINNVGETVEIQMPEIPYRYFRV